MLQTALKLPLFGQFFPPQCERTCRGPVGQVTGEHICQITGEHVGQGTGKHIDEVTVELTVESWIIRGVGIIGGVWHCNNY